MQSNFSAQAVEIAPGTYWVGKRTPGEIFHANPYLRVFQGQDAQGASKTFNLLIDPGSNKEFAIVRSKVEQVIGSMDRVGGVFINHQDPDVASSVGTILGRHSPRSWVLCTEDTWRLVHYYNIPRQLFVPLERYAYGLQFPTGDVLMPVPSPFCHFVGATMLYDPKTRVLFSGDLFGGLTEKDAQGIWADESDWTGMRAFHQIYMPTNKALRQAVARIRALTPAVQTIAPQHGRLIRGKLVQTFLDRIESLPVGLDLIEEDAGVATLEDTRHAWLTVLNRVLEVAEAFMGGEARERLRRDNVMRGLCEEKQGRFVLTGSGKAAVERALLLLLEHQPQEVSNPIKYEAIHATAELDLPTPSIEMEEAGVTPGGGGGDDDGGGFRMPAFGGPRG